MKYSDIQKINEYTSKNVPNIKRYNNPNYFEDLLRIADKTDQENDN